LYQGKPNITCITAGSAAVNGSHYTRRSKGICTPSPAMRKPFDRPRYGRGLEGREKEGDCNLTPASCDTMMAQYWVLATRTDDAAPLHQQEVITTVLTVNHSNVSAN